MPDWLDAGGQGTRCDVPAMFDSKVPELIATLVGLGALVSLGVTSDGGALGVTVTVDGRWRREYFRDGEALEEWVAEAILALEPLLADLRASSASRSRSRGRRGP